MRESPVSCLLIVLVLVGSGCLGPASVDGVWEDYLDSKPAAFLSGVIYPDLVVEIDFERGWAPSDFAVDALAQTLREVTTKQSIRFVKPEPFDVQGENGGSEEWEFAEVLALHDRLFDSAPPRAFANGSAGVIHIIYLTGDLMGAAGVELGFARVVMIDKIRPDPMGPPDLNALLLGGEDLERHVLIHEVGHALGLVNNGVPMVRDHAMPNDPVHSANHESVMSGRRYVHLLNSTPDLDIWTWRFDENDLLDLRTFERQLQTYANAHPRSER